MIWNAARPFFTLALQDVGREVQEGIQSIRICTIAGLPERDCTATQLGGSVRAELPCSSRSRRFPITVTHLPVTRCQLCHRTVAYRPSLLSEVLTDHYRLGHPEVLGIPFR
jgi:hypothetical protein